MGIEQRDARPIAVLGLGSFGVRLAERLTAGDEDVLACDKSRGAVESIADRVAHAVMLNATDADALRNAGVDKAKAAVVAIGEQFETAVLATVTLRELGVPRIVARARTRAMAEVLRRVGAQEIVLAEDEAADRWANRLLGPNVLNQIEFHEGYSLVEYRLPESWDGKSLAELDLRRQHALHVVALRRGPEDSDRTRIEMPGPTDPLRTGSVLIIMGRDEDLARLAALAPT